MTGHGENGPKYSNEVQVAAGGGGMAGFAGAAVAWGVIEGQNPQTGQTTQHPALTPVETGGLFVGGTLIGTLALASVVRYAQNVRWRRSRDRAMREIEAYANADSDT